MILIRHGQSEWNLHFSRDRIDPGIRDAELTEAGRAQAAEAAEQLAHFGIERLIASPYRRALQTAEIIAGRLALPIEITPLVGERAAFSCDEGSHRDDLAARWPHLKFDHLPHPWWPEMEESPAALALRCAAFRKLTDPLADRDRVAIVSHWGFIQGLTGLSVQNGWVVRLSLPQGPGRPAEAEVVHPR